MKVREIFEVRILKLLNLDFFPLVMFLISFLVLINFFGDFQKCGP